MGYERYSRDSNQGAYYNPEQNAGDYGRDYGSGRDYSYSSARQYAAAGEYDRDRGGNRNERDGRSGYGDDFGGNRWSGDSNRGNYGPQEYGNSGYANRSQFGGRQEQGGYGGGNHGGGYDRDRSRGGSGAYGSQDRSRDSYGSYGRQDRSFGGNDRSQRDRSYGNQPQGYDYQDRGFVQRAGDEVRSWFGDEDASRRRDQDARMDQQHQDSDYHSWRQSQNDAFDRDYAEYRQENRSKFASEFGTWRTGRQTQRDSLTKAKEHMDVVGSDGSHVGTVDHIRGDRILLTKNDQDAGGRHHSIPSSWIESVDDKVTLRKTAEEAKSHWRDEENNQAMFGGQGATASSASSSGSSYGASGSSTAGQGNQTTGDTNLNRSFSGTY